MTDAADSTERPAARPMLRGERIWLRPIEPGDVVEDSQMANDAEIGHFLGAKLPMSRTAAERLGGEILSQVGQTGYPFAICLLGTTQSIGTIFLRSVDKVNGSGEVGIFVGDQRYLGQGYGTDALNALVDFGFGELRLERIELHVFDYNARAQRSYEKAGFRQDAVLRRARFHRGDFHDVINMSILRDDWLALERQRSWELTGP